MNLVLTFFFFKIKSIVYSGVPIAAVQYGDPGPYQSSPSFSKSFRVLNGYVINMPDLHLLPTSCQFY